MIIPESGFSWFTMKLLYCFKLNEWIKWITVVTSGKLVFIYTWKYMYRVLMVLQFGIWSKHSKQACFYFSNQSTEGAEFFWVSECQKDEGCEIINQFVLYSATSAFQRLNCS
jgi:hypothetical protein